MIDVLLYLVPSQVFSHAEHLTAKEHPVYCYLDPQWIWQIKSSKGYPWDSLYYDQNLVYQVHTEGQEGWHNPQSFKAFNSQSFGGAHGGIAWCPRWVNEDASIPEPVVTADTTYDEYLNGKIVATRNLGGPAVCQISGPKELECGRLGVRWCLVQSYQWDKDLIHMEVNQYALGLGWVRWQLYHQKGGRYALLQETLFDSREDGGTPDLVPPNPMP
jgi:hypothetical protein